MNLFGKKLNKLFSATHQSATERSPDESPAHMPLASCSRHQHFRWAKCRDLNARLLETNKPLVMLSYVHAEAQLYALNLKKALEKLELSVYLDLDEIYTGLDWQDSLNCAVTACQAFVPLVTPSYGDTLWTSRELKLADLLSKHIIPINFGQPWPPAPLAIQFATIQYVNWTDKAAKSYHVETPSQRRAEWRRDSVRSVARRIKQAMEEQSRRLGQHHQYTSAEACLDCATNKLKLERHLQLSAADSGYSESSSPPAHALERLNFPVPGRKSEEAVIVNYGSFSQRCDRLSSSSSSGSSSGSLASSINSKQTSCNISDSDNHNSTDLEDADHNHHRLRADDGQSEAKNSGQEQQQPPQSMLGQSSTERKRRRKSWVKRGLAGWKGMWRPKGEVVH